jgi:hypothetical protein
MATTTTQQDAGTRKWPPDGEQWHLLLFTVILYSVRMDPLPPFFFLPAISGAMLLLVMWKPYDERLHL